jgi:hypothetical protein
MKKVALIGGYDKTDLIIYAAKILTVLKKKILYIDTTITEKTKYIVPTMTPTRKYITTFDGIDIAIGFTSMQDVRDYMGVEKELDYDYAFVDLDAPENYISFEFSPVDIHFFITSFDVYSVQKGVSVLRAIKAPTEIMKVIYTKDPESEEKEYLDFITLNYRVNWKDDVVYFPFETDDFYAIFQNQRFSRVRFSGLSNDYMEALSYFLENLSGKSNGEIKRAIKAIEKTY